MLKILSRSSYFKRDTVNGFGNDAFFRTSKSDVLQSYSRQNPATLVLGVFENSLIPLSNGAIVRNRRIFSRATNIYVKHIKSSGVETWKSEIVDQLIEIKNA